MCVCVCVREWMCACTRARVCRGGRCISEGLSHAAVALRCNNLSFVLLLHTSFSHLRVVLLLHTHARADARAHTLRKGEPYLGMKNENHLRFYARSCVVMCVDLLHGVWVSLRIDLLCNLKATERNTFRNTSIQQLSLTRTLVSHDVFIRDAYARVCVWEGTKELVQAGWASCEFCFVRRPRVWIAREVMDAAIIAVMQHSEERWHPHSPPPACLHVLMQQKKKKYDGDHKEERWGRFAVLARLKRLSPEAALFWDANWIGYFDNNAEWSADFSEHRAPVWPFFLWHRFASQHVQGCSARAQFYARSLFFCSCTVALPLPLQTPPPPLIVLGGVSAL